MAKLAMSLGSIHLAKHAIHIAFTLDSKPELTVEESKLKEASEVYLTSLGITDEDGSVQFSDSNLPKAVNKAINKYC